jgi:hypothetical protein
MGRTARPERSRIMSQLYDMREALAASIIAADIGWTAADIILKRQTDLWNDVATALAGSETGAVLHIGVAEGDSTEEDGLEMNVTVPLTILCPPNLTEGATPEEDLWEALVTHVHDLRLGSDSFAYRFRFKSFTDVEIEADGGTGYLGRQTIFQRKLSL